MISLKPEWKSGQVIELGYNMGHNRGHNYAVTSVSLSDYFDGYQKHQMSKPWLTDHILWETQWHQHPGVLKISSHNKHGYYLNLSSFFMVMVPGLKIDVHNYRSAPVLYCYTNMQKTGNDHHIIITEMSMFGSLIGSKLGKYVQICST